jgi:hypothetical protein
MLKLILSFFVQFLFLSSSGANSNFSNPFISPYFNDDPLIMICGGTYIGTGSATDGDNACLCNEIIDGLPKKVFRPKYDTVRKCEIQATNCDWVIADNEQELVNLAFMESVFDAYNQAPDNFCSPLYCEPLHFVLGESYTPGPPGHATHTLEISCLYK